MPTYSIIQKSQLEGALRLDAEYYQPEYLELNKEIDKNKKVKLFEELLEPGNSLTGGATPLGAEYPNAGIKFLRVQNIMPGYLDFSDIVYIDEKLHKGALKRSRLMNDDVLLTITGVSYGKAAVYKEKFGEANINQHSVRMHFNDEEVLPEYVATFLNSKYGRYQSDRKITGDTRPALAYEEIKNFKISLIDKKQQNIIKDLYKDGEQADDESNKKYSQAEDLLLEELGLKDFKAEEKLFCVVNLSETKTANRIDAEYFNSEVNRIIEKVSKNNSVPLGDLVDMQKGIEIGTEAYQEQGKLFVRVSSIAEQEIIDKDQKYLSDELYQKYKKDYQPQIGEILLTKDATPGISYVIKEPIEGIICGGIMRLKVKENIEPEYLSLCINSIIGKSQVERDAGGSIIAHWKPEQIKNLQVPILSKPIQKKIADLVRQSHVARQKAKQLLEEAKRKVEEMIENEN